MYINHKTQGDIMNAAVNIEEYLPADVELEFGSNPWAAEDEIDRENLNDYREGSL